MISVSAEDLRVRVERVAGMLGGLRSEIVEGTSLIGGGSTPEEPLPSWLIAVQSVDAVEAEKRCRLSQPPLVARIEDGRLLFDLRTFIHIIKKYIPLGKR